MKIINTRIHGVLDYIFAVALIAFPWLFDTGEHVMAKWLPIVLGAITIVYSLLTDYEAGVANVLTMRKHLLLDVGAGFILTISPWLFGFADVLIAPYLIAGFIEITIAMMSDPRPSKEAKEHQSLADRPTGIARNVPSGNEGNV